MGFKRSFLKIVLRVLIIVGWVFSMSYTYFKTDLTVTPIMFGLLTLFSIVELTSFLRRQERNWISFLASVRHQDFNRIYKRQASKELSDAYELISQSMEELQTNNQVDYRLIQTVLGHISVGVVCYQANGNVIFTNKAFDALLNIPGLVHTDRLKNDHSQIYEVITKTESNPSGWIDHENGQKLFVKTESFKLKGVNHTLVSLTDIRSSLDAKELESYQKLMRVMTHEIMNSTNPILSLIRVVNKKLIHGNELSVLEEKDQKNTVTSLKAIEERTSGILKFVSAYKEINQSIQPHFELVKSEDLLSSIETLMDQSKDVKFHIEDELNEHLSIDLSLINQVLINLVKNALEALINVDKAMITISLRKKEDQTIIEVTDNGNGVPASNIQQIFVPFYTTKSGGSGIGLALSRKIVKAHGGTLEYHRDKGKTSFVIQLPSK